MPGTTIPEPSPFEHVTEHAQPSRSSTAMCVVEPSLPLRPRKRADELGVGEPLEELRRALVLGALHHLHERFERRAAAGSASSSASACAIRIPPADGGGLVSTSRPR